MNDQSTKQRLLAAGQHLMLERSFHAVGLSELLKEVNVPKGCFYHYFDSKEQFGVELLEEYLSKANERRRHFLLRSEVEPNPVLRLHSFIETLIANVLQNDGKCPCLAAKLASEVCGLSEPMREVLHKHTKETISIYETLLAECAEKQLLNSTVPLPSLASGVHALLLGALQQCGVSRTATPARHAAAFIKSFLI